MSVLRIGGVVPVVLLLAACAAPSSLSVPSSPLPPSVPAPVLLSPSLQQPPSAAPSLSAPQAGIGYPVVGGAVFAFASGSGAVAGSAGQLLSYRVGVESDISGISAAEFGDAVAGVFADPRSWPGTGQWRLRWAGAGEPFDFTIYLATPATRDTLCGNGYDRYTSCRNGDSVIINVARWAHGVPDYGGDLTSYQQYVINHETGHRLGRGHELCPGPGRPAPVMQQQTLGMHGCVSNPWPIVDGRPYAGRSGQYDDPTPKDP